MRIFLSLIILYFKNTFRNLQKILYLMFFSFLIIIIFAFSFQLPQNVLKKVFSGIIWVVIILGSMPMISLSFKDEENSGLIYCYKLSKISMTTLLFSRFLANFLIIMFWEFLVLFFSIIFLNINFSFDFGYFSLILIIGNIGYILLSTFFSMILGAGQNIFMSIIIYPLILPLIMSILKMSEFLLINNLSSDFYFWLKLSISFDIIYIGLIILFSEFIFDN